MKPLPVGFKAVLILLLALLVGQTAAAEGNVNTGLFSEVFGSMFPGYHGLSERSVDPAKPAAKAIFSTFEPRTKQEGVEIIAAPRETLDRESAINGLSEYLALFGVTELPEMMGMLKDTSEKYNRRSKSDTLMLLGYGILFFLTCLIHIALQVHLISHKTKFNEKLDAAKHNALTEARSVEPSRKTSSSTKQGSPNASTPSKMFPFGGVSPTQKSSATAIFRGGLYPTQMSKISNTQLISPTQRISASRTGSSSTLTAMPSGTQLTQISSVTQSVTPKTSATQLSNMTRVGSASLVAPKSSGTPISAMTRKPSKMGNVTQMPFATAAPEATMMPGGANNVILRPSTTDVSPVMSRSSNSKMPNATAMSKATQLPGGKPSKSALFDKNYETFNNLQKIMNEPKPISFMRI
ncbi:hypothetical protein L596_018674 [Steinernema carpocapsae]|uniref:Uncharacterized protein n=1 Tax=Steinernema carpocapsae TaxID=34508 RepID=A0A4U5N6E4_STECR|nr:hypothetical protein L596_018674 [Steinernema carpocapsae]